MYAYILMTTFGLCAPNGEYLRSPHASQHVTKILIDASLVARSIEDAKQRADALLALADVYSRAGDCRAAHRCLQESIELLQEVVAQEGDEQEYLIAAVASRQAEIGDLRGAVKSIEVLTSAGARDLTRSAVITTLLSREQHESAISIAGAIENTDVKDASLSEIAEYLAANGDVEHAAELVEAIVDGSWKEPAFLLVALAQASAGDLASAQQTVALIEMPALKVRGLSEIALAQINAGHERAASQIYLEAKEITETAEIESPQLIIIQARLGDLPGALEAAEAMSGSLRRDRVLKQIIAGLVDDRRIREALRILTRMVSDVEKAEAMRYVAFQQANAGCVSDALGTARQIDVDAVRSEALRRIAAIQFELCDCLGANAVLSEAERAAKAVEIGGGTEVILLREIAVVQANGGNCNAAKHAFGVAVKASGAYRDDSYRAELLFDIARAQSEAGLSNQTLEWAREIKSPIGRAHALIGVAHGMLDRAYCTP